MKKGSLLWNTVHLLSSYCHRNKSVHKHTKLTRAWWWKFQNSAAIIIFLDEKREEEENRAWRKAWMIGFSLKCKLVYSKQTKQELVTNGCQFQYGKRSNDAWKFPVKVSIQLLWWIGVLVRQRECVTHILGAYTPSGCCCYPLLSSCASSLVWKLSAPLDRWKNPLARTGGIVYTTRTHSQECRDTRSEKNKIGRLNTHESKNRIGMRQTTKQLEGKPQEKTQTAPSVGTSIPTSFKIIAQLLPTLR